MGDRESGPLLSLAQTGRHSPNHRDREREKQTKRRHSERTANQVNPFSWNEQKNSTSYAAAKFDIPADVGLSSEQQRLKLSIFQRRFDAGNQLGKISDHRGRLVKGIVLTHRDKEDIFAVEEGPDIFACVCQSIVGRDSQYDRARVSQMRLDRQRHAGVGNSVCQLSQRVSGAGSNHHDIQQFLGADGFGLDDGVQNLVSAGGLDALTECLCLTEAGVRLIGVRGHDGDDFPVWVGGCLLQLGDDLLESAEGAGQGESDPNGLGIGLMNRQATSPHLFSFRTVGRTVGFYHVYDSVKDDMTGCDRSDLSGQSQRAQSADAQLFGSRKVNSAGQGG